jgi:hypothetical protein
VRGVGRRLRKGIAKRERVSTTDVLLDSMKRTYISNAKANATSNVIRNLWAHAIIFCGHFPDQAYVFTQDETEEETTGARYVRQLLGACNIEGGPMFHLMSGNLGYQVEHHLYPDMPSTRYAEIAPAVRDICQRYELPYNTGPFFKQWYMVNRTIVRLAFPGGKPRPKPGPYRGEPNRSAIKNENKGFAREGYVPRAKQQEAEKASASNGAGSSNGSS